ncbi:MAG: ABC transporter permease subunit [Leptolyngbyaceae bacterium]|nr:ABC transporter permease subunit [Leptolyngbyaceae bacterium]
MLTSLLDTIGDWNPQLLRELKGQLKPIKIGLAIALALITQAVFLLIVWGQLPGWLEPSHLSVTTYPKIQTDYNGTGPISISYLEYDYPLEKHPNYDITATGLEQYSDQVRVGDRIIAIDGQPFIWDEVGENNVSKQTVLDMALQRPFADEIQQLNLDIHALNSESIRLQAAQTLRQQVPGTTVNLTLSREGVSEPFDVALPRIVASTRTSSYCLPLENWQTQVSDGNRRYSPCSVSVGEQQYQINGNQWHRDAFWGLSITVLFPFLILSTYTLINNLLKEERDGTLNFIRLSPQSAAEILMGKMLGVPALIYLAVGCALPLHLFHGLSAGLGWGLMAAFYSATVAIAFLTFSMALLMGMINMSLGMVQAWLGGGSVFLIQLLACKPAAIPIAVTGIP